MLTSKYAAPFRRIRWLPALVGVGIFLGSLLYFRGRAQPWIDSGPVSGSPFIFKGPDAQDKVVVMAKTANQTVDWAYEGLKDWQLAIYHMDDPTNVLHPPKNKGREAMAYLTFLIDHYHILPHLIVFLHPHLQGWPEAWHTDAPEYNNIKSVQSLRTEYVEDHGYANMRCIHNPGCPDEIQPFREDPNQPAERAFADAWIDLFGGNMTSVPQKIATPCCAQFAVSADQVLKRERQEYIRYRQWLLDTKLDDATSGRVFEYLWHVIFGKPPVWCPALGKCWCDQFGRC